MLACGKKINNNDTLTHICLLPLFQMASYYVTYLGWSVVNKSHDFVIGQPSLKSKPD